MLEPKIRSQLIEAHQELVDQGKLPSREQLGRYYDIFRERFGPERLTSLDGEALLEYMHLHGNYDSLVYWLEFKNDEEFPAIFGSIAGGSALKFGIYRSATTGAWMNGTPLHMNEISVDEAVNRARKHRDQFVHGATVLERFPRNGSDADYARLQAEMDRVAPDVSNLAWGHKYFSLLYPELLDDYHNPDYQRFHLIKLLQIPPSGNGRYIKAGASSHWPTSWISHSTT
ncbi:MAG TPA: hypothetical protein VEZ12_07820 [Herpetosiphonaceae bacterium]|nr:hypothetical protein [Herpetosiphonaceae bacterium]